MNYTRRVVTLGIYTVSGTGISRSPVAPRRSQYRKRIFKPIAPKVIEGDVRR